VYETKCFYCGSLLTPKTDGSAICACGYQKIMDWLWVSMDEVINGKRYQTHLSTLMAFDRDPGLSFEKAPRRATNWKSRADGKRKGLFRTPNGRYFIQYEEYKGESFISDYPIPESTKIKTVSDKKALEIFWKMSEKLTSAEEAFPDIKIEDA
jgi:hypothetical protein